MQHLLRMPDLTKPLVAKSKHSDQYCGSMNFLPIVAYSERCNIATNGNNSAIL